jgi:hypothetical protein
MRVLHRRVSEELSDRRGDLSQRAIHLRTMRMRESVSGTADNVVALRKFIRLQCGSLEMAFLQTTADFFSSQLMMPTSSWVQEVVGRPYVAPCHPGLMFDQIWKS